MEGQGAAAPGGSLIDFGVADDVVAGLRGRLADLKADTPGGYEAVKAGIAEVRTIRVGVEKSRKELKQSALEWGRKVDAEAKRVTEMLRSIEDPLKEEKARVDEAKERAVREQLEAEERAIAEERAKLEAEQRKRDAEQREALERERRELEEERRKLQAERDRLEAEKRAKEEAERKARAEAERKEREAREAREAEQRAKAEADRRAKEEAERKRLEAERRPDREKLAEFAETLRTMELPSVTTKWGLGVLNVIARDLTAIADRIDQS